MSWRVDGTSMNKGEYDRRLEVKPSHGIHFEPPWNDIGYHFGIELINDQYEVLIGRNLDQQGAHCLIMNQKALGICFVGNFDEAAPPQEQWQKGIELVRSLIYLLNIPRVYVVGHRDYAPDRTCPGKLFDLEKFRKDLAAA